MKTRCLTLALMGVGLMLSGGTLLAQGSADNAAATETLEQAAARIEDVERRMREAQARLEEAAREVARLSAERAGPLPRNFEFYRNVMAQRPLLGINIDDADRGVEVVGVTPNGPAAEAGIVAGDVLVAIDGRSLAPAAGETATRKLLDALEGVEAGDTVNLDVDRDGTTRTVSVEARELPVVVFAHDVGDIARPGLPGLPVEPGRRVAIGPGGVMRNGNAMFFETFARTWWQGMELVELTPTLGAYFGTDQGLLVVRAPDNEALGLMDGDVILSIGGRVPTTAEHGMRILGSFEPGEELELRIMRKQRRETLMIELPDAPPRPAFETH